MVELAGSTTGIVHPDMTLTRSKVKVTGLLNFRELAMPCMLAAIPSAPFAGLSGSGRSPCDSGLVSSLSVVFLYVF